MPALRNEVHQLLGVMAEVFMVVAAGLTIYELVRLARHRQRHRLFELAFALALAGLMVQNPLLPAQVLDAILGFLGFSASPPP